VALELPTFTISSSTILRNNCLALNLSEKKRFGFLFPPSAALALLLHMKSQHEMEVVVAVEEVEEVEDVEDDDDDDEDDDGEEGERQEDDEEEDSRSMTDIDSDDSDDFDSDDFDSDSDFDSDDFDSDSEDISFFFKALALLVPEYNPLFSCLTCFLIFPFPPFLPSP